VWTVCHRWKRCQTGAEWNYRLQIQTEIWWVCKKTIFRMELIWRITRVFVNRCGRRVIGNRLKTGDWTSVWRLAGDRWMECRQVAGEVQVFIKTQGTVNEWEEWVKLVESWHYPFKCINILLFIGQVKTN